jgi:hypothetical protein
MAKSKQRGKKKVQPPAAPVVPQSLAIPPPDNPLLRHDALGADQQIAAREQAQKRLEALKKTRQMPTSDEPEAKP